MKVRETRAGLPFQHPRASVAGGHAGGSVSMRGTDNPGRGGAVLRCSSVSLHFCSPASQTPPSAPPPVPAPVALAVHKPGED